MRPAGSAASESSLPDSAARFQVITAAATCSHPMSGLSQPQSQSSSSRKKVTLRLTIPPRETMRKIVSSSVSRSRKTTPARYNSTPRDH